MTDLERKIRLFADNKEIAKELRIRIRGCATMTLLPNGYYIDVYDMDNQEVEFVRNAKVVYATGADDETMICYGEVEDIYIRESDTSIVSTLVVSDGKAFWDTVLSESLGGKATVRATINHLVPNGVLTVYNADDKQILRGQAYIGRLADTISMLAKSVNARAYFMNGCLFLTSKNRTAQMYTIDDNEFIADPEEAKGVLIIRAIVKGYSVGSVYRYAENDYRLVTQKIDADNRNGLWQCELMFVKESFLDENGMGGG